MVKRNEIRREPARHEVEQKTDRGVQIAAIAAVVVCSIANGIFAVQGHEDAIPWYVLAGLIGIAGGKEIATAIFGRLGGRS